MRLLLFISVIMLCIFDASAQRNPIKPIQNVLDKIKRANNVRKATTKSIKTVKKLVENNNKKEHSNKSYHRSCITNEIRVANGAMEANRLLRQKSEPLDTTIEFAFPFNKINTRAIAFPIEVYIKAKPITDIRTQPIELIIHDLKV